MDSRRRFQLGCWLALATCCALQACAVSERVNRAERPQPQFRIVRHVGGVPGCLAVVDGVWLQAIGATIEIIEPTTGRTLRSLSLVESGDGGRIVDMAVAQRRLLVVLDREAVCELDVSDPLHLRLVRREEAADLGLAPHMVSVAGDDAFISGTGGVVRWRDRQRFLAEQGEIGAVAQVDGRLIACVGRRVLELNSGAYLGAANDLQPWPRSSSLDPAFVFMLKGESATTVGLMSSAIREVDRVTLRDPVRQVRVFADRVWVVTDQDVIAFSCETGRMAERLRIPLELALDVAQLSSNEVAVSTRCGPSLYWIDEQLRGTRWLKQWQRELATGLTDAWSDGRRVLVRDNERCWSFSADDGGLHEIEASQIRWPGPQLVAAGVWGRAEIDDDGRAVMLTTPTGAESRIAAPADGSIECVASVDGELWLGTTQGISVVETGAAAGRAPSVAARQDLRVDGDVFAIHPHLNGSGAFYVTRYGGIGMVEAHASARR